MKKVFVSWSAGKDSCLALYRIRNEFNVEYLVNMVSEDGKHSRSHGVDINLIKQQAEAMDIPLVHKTTSWQEYEDVFKRTLLDLKAEGIEYGIFGDIDLQLHRDWEEKVSVYAGMEAVLPLWQGDRESLLREFIDAEFKAVVVVVNEKFMDKKWLGRVIDDEFIINLKKHGNVDLCGENGEYHTFVFDGPLFKEPVGFKTSDIIQADGYSFLQLRPYL
ncbi:MAG: diphthine--ammonia ligase [PVC group bacterium]|nr:diphthine--ammonia ligase [PVC group bacterium]